MPQHLKPRQKDKTPGQERKRKKAQNPRIPSKILPPPWVIPLIDKEEKPPDNERPVREIDEPPPELYDIVWPPKDQENDKKKDEDERGVVIIELQKKKERQGAIF